MEQLKEYGFIKNMALMLVEDRLFYTGRKMDGIYSYFRNNKQVHGKINKPTGQSKDNIIIDGKYSVIWNSVGIDNMYYNLIEI